MITDKDMVWIGNERDGRIFALTAPIPRSHGEDWLRRYEARGEKGPCAYQLIPVPYCQVCGETGRARQPGQIRCRKHADRNPCAIEGCQRSTKAPESGALRLDQWFCGEHWRAFVPPGSAERRIYHRFFRVAKRYGWTHARERAFFRIWDRIVSRARARGRGDLDVAEINRVMGW